MNIHEYQAKTILSSYVPVPRGAVALNIGEIKSAVAEITTPVIVVKSQIHAGGRGKAGGVKLAKSKEEAEIIAKSMFGMTLVTPQTGPEGQKVRRVYFEEGSNIEKEFYLSAVVDRSSNSILFMASCEGGMEIEEVAAKNPEKIFKISIDPATGMKPFHGRKLAFLLGLTGKQVGKFTKMALGLYQAFIDHDASQVEVNPLVLTREGEVIALDAKFNFDDNALYKHPKIVEMRDESEEDEYELKAAKSDISYVKMDGEIGCMVNGAGLAMATMDIIKLYGAEPANFLDVGGGADKEKVTEAFRIIFSDPGVRGVLINIFGGITRCDVIAEGIIAAAKEVDVKVPLVVRLAGTNFELGKKLLDESDLEITSADDLADAAEKIVKAVKGK
ncbi:MAG: ADP-forming succinate--CoA ligase subunit beta [Rickettsiales bacterium]|jgi:succinyl-CoA synthetase beta subunit|nr:ADP-forming succinate--CoA ligase subunit beta [Rickettsiales bacterium]